MLLREEEQALKRALYVSLRDTKSGNDGSSFSAKKNTEDINESSIATISSTNDNRSSGQLKKRRCVKSLELLNIPQKQSELPLPDSRQVNYEDSGCAATSPSSSDPFGRSLYQGIGASSDLKRQDISIVGSISKRYVFHIMPAILELRVLRVLRAWGVHFDARIAVVSCVFVYFVMIDCYQCRGRNQTFSNLKLPFLAKFVGMNCRFLTLFHT